MHKSSQKMAVKKVVADLVADVVVVESEEVEAITEMVVLKRRESLVMINQNFLGKVDVAMNAPMTKVQAEDEDVDSFYLRGSTRLIW